MNALAPKISPLSKADWLALKAKADAAKSAVDDLSLALLTHAKQADDAQDAFLRDAFFKESGKAFAASGAFLNGYFYHPQGEWTGGDSFDPAHTVTREPHFTNGRRLTVQG